VVDVGCGPGNSTEALALRFPRARLRAFDSSADMIDAARRRMPQVPFEVADVVPWSTGAARFDVILANAVLQWVPDHTTLFAALARKLTRGGALAVQMPDNLTEPAHEFMRQVALAGPWAGKLAAASGARTALEPASWYVDRLTALGCRVEVWRTTYFHALEGPAAIVEWFKGSGLRPFLDPLNAEERTEYVRRFTAAVATAYPPLADGRVLLAFPRLFIVAIGGC
jgi:trans-aconitate 2-methyltransferase